MGGHSMGIGSRKGARLCSIASPSCRQCTGTIISAVQYARADELTAQWWSNSFPFVRALELLSPSRVSAAAHKKLTCHPMHKLCKTTYSQFQLIFWNNY